MVLAKRSIHYAGDSPNNLSSIVDILNLIGSVLFLVSAILVFFIPGPTIPECDTRSMNERTRDRTQDP
jgi:hypothetical protein